MRVDKMVTVALGAAARMPSSVVANHAGRSDQSPAHDAHSGLLGNHRVALSGGSQPGRVSLPGRAPIQQANAGKPAAVECNGSTGGRAAAVFQQNFAGLVQAHPMGSVMASRHDLGLKPHDFAMVDIGGEGQKTTDDGMKSGNLHAINVNAQSNISPGPMSLQTAPGDTTAAKPINGGQIPNLVQIKEWPPGGQASATGMVPLDKGFSNLTMMEGAPVHPYHVGELDRVTAGNGWIALTVDQQFKPQIDRLAQQRNGGEVWQLSKASATDNDRFIVPPAGLSPQQKSDFKARLEAAGPHEIYDVAKQISQEHSAPAKAAPPHQEL